MRLLKFRAWDKNSELMITEGGYIQIDGNGNFDIFNEANNSWDKNGVDGNDLILMQFTGLKDKKGKEIYEGDIVKQSKWIKEVEFEDCSFGIRKEIDGQTYGKCFAPLYQFKGEIEVIGDIYTTPELLNPPNKE